MYDDKDFDSDAQIMVTDFLTKHNVLQEGIIHFGYNDKDFSLVITTKKEHDTIVPVSLFEQIAYTTDKGAESISLQEIDYAEGTYFREISYTLKKDFSYNIAASYTSQGVFNSIETIVTKKHDDETTNEPLFDIGEAHAYFENDELIVSKEIIRKKENIHDFHKEIITAENSVIDLNIHLKTQKHRGQCIESSFYDKLNNQSYSDGRFHKNYDMIMILDLILGNFRDADIVEIE